MTEQRVDVALVPRHLDAVNVGGFDRVLRDQPQRGVHHRLLDGAAREAFDQIAGRREHPRPAKTIDDA